MKEARKDAVTMAHVPGLTDEGVSGVTQTAADSSGAPGNPATVPPPPPKVDAYIGKTIDARYLVEQVLGEGGMGVVYRGRHKVIDKRVAIKVLRSEMSSDLEMTERFLQEARAASSIGNPHIVDISDFGKLPDGATYFVMEHLDGGDLSALMDSARDKGPLGVRRIVHIAKQIAQGLNAAHEAGIVHRDLKPDNVMLIKHGTDTDFVKILDFGIAKVGQGTARLTRAGSVFGTPHYMSPEQAAGTEVDKRTDIYSLGVILYEMASGRVPFDADNFMGILTQHMYKAPPSILALVPPPGDVPPGLDAIVLKCLSKKPDNRYASMADLFADLEKLEQGIVPLAVSEMMGRSGGFNVPADYFRGVMPAPVPATPYTKRSRTPLFAVIGGVAVLGLVALVAMVLPNKPSVAQTPPSKPAPQATVVTSPVVTVPGAGVASIEVLSKQVLVGVDPMDAKVMRDGNPMGDPPYAIEVRPGEVVVLTAKRAGYRDQTMTLTDQSAPKMTLKMFPTAPIPQTAAAVVKPTVKPTVAVDPKSGQGTGTGGSDFSDPWKK